MAIYGIGASYRGTQDVSQDFLNVGLACVGHNEKDAPPLHTILKHFKIGDIVYIKAHPPQKRQESWHRNAGEMGLDRRRAAG